MKKETKKFLQRFLICLIVYALLIAGILVILTDVLKKANTTIKIIVGVGIVLLFVALIVYVEISRRRKEK